MSEEAQTPSPWDKLDAETDDAWGAFRNYRDQLPPRRLKQCSIMRLEVLSRWYNQYNWHDRVTAYDRHLDKIRRDEREAIIKTDEKERAGRQLALLAGVQDLLDRELEKLLADSNATEAWGLLKVGEWNTLLESKIKLERLIHGESTEKTEVTVDFSKLTIDELRTLRALEKKLHGGENE